MTNHLKHWLAALYLPGIGARRIFEYLKTFSSIERLFETPEAELKSLGFAAHQVEKIKQPDWKSVDADLAWGDAPGQHVIAYDDVDYPQLLKETADPPLVLYVRGDKTALSTMQIAIVGSRHATPAGLNNAEQFATSLAEMKLTITSGLALGIDGAAHRGALSANGITIGVAGTGLKYIYPKSHTKLIEKIIEQNGAIISEFPLTTPPFAQNFPRRNRIISGLSVGVLVVEAALKSGSLITARCALEEGREVFAVPGSIHNPLVRGCHHLLRQGAILVETVEDITAELAGFCKTACNNPSSKEALEPQEIALLEKIEYEITAMDVIILRSTLTASEVSSILLALELKGYIQSVPGGYIRLS